MGGDVGLARLATLSTANNPGNYHPDGRAKTGCTTWVKSARMTRTE